MQDIARQSVIALRWLPLILVFAIGAGAVAYVYASGRPSEYEATGTLLVDPGRDAAIQDRSGAVLAAVSYAADMESPSFLRAIINELDLDTTPESLTRRISADADPDAEIALIGLTVQARDPEEAQAIAEALGNLKIARVENELVNQDVRDVNAAIRKVEYDIQSLRRRLSNLRSKPNKDAEDFAEIRSLPGDIATLQRSIIDYRPFSKDYVRNLLEWVVKPQVPTEPSGLGPLYLTLLALVAGGMLAVAIAFVIEYLRHYNKVRDERDLELAIGLPALGSVTEKRGDVRRGGPNRLVVLRAPASDTAEGYRGLLARIGFAGGSTRSLMVASAGPTDARGAVAANIALAYAEAGRNVVLVDADFRSPRQHALFGVQNDRGITNILVDVDIPLSWVIVPTAHPKLQLMPAGPPPPRASFPLDARQVQTLLGRLLATADLVVVDSPPVSGSLDAAVLAAHVEESILVVPADSRLDAVAEAAGVLNGAEAAFVGAVLYRQVRGEHRGSVPTPMMYPPPGPSMRTAPPPSPPRRIPAVVPGAAQPPMPQPAQGSTNPARPTTPNSEGAPVAPTPGPGPYSVPFRPDSPPRDGTASP